MSYLNIKIPPFPYFLRSGNALYRPGDIHMNRKGLDFFDFLFVEQGVLHMQLEHENYNLNAGSGLIIPPNFHHFGSKICTEKTLFHWLHFDTPQAFTVTKIPRPMEDDILQRNERFDKVVSVPIFQTVPPEQAKMLCHLLTKLETISFNRFERATYSARGVNNAFHQQELMMRILQTIAISNNGPLTDDIPFTLMQYITASHADKIQLSTLAKIANCHPSHVIRCIKKQYNMTPMQLVTSVRLQHACELLRNSTMSITEISYAVGFPSASYFGKQFKQLYNTSPSSYRNIRAETPNY